MDNQTLVEIILDRKQELGMNWKDMEEKSGVTWCTVRGWRTGKNGAMLETAARVLDALGLELQAIPKDTGRMYTVEEVEAVMHGACEDGRRGFDPYDCMISDYI